MTDEGQEAIGRPEISKSVNVSGKVLPGGQTLREDAPQQFPVEVCA